MNHIYDNQEREGLIEARESFSGRLLTDTQFYEAVAITGIIEREISRTGKFKEKLGDYAHAFARTNNFDVMKAEEIIRDVFKARCGQTMNQMREGLMSREEQIFTGQKTTEPNGEEVAEVRLSQSEINRVATDTREIEPMIRDGNKMSFYRAYSHQASNIAKELGITESKTKALMGDIFRAQEKQNLYDWGKKLEDEYYRPQIEAEAQARQANRSNVSDMGRTRRFARSR